MTDRQLLIDCLQSLNSESSTSVLLVVTRAAAAFLTQEEARADNDLANIAFALGDVPATKADILAAIERLKKKAAAARTKTVFDMWEKGAKRGSQKTVRNSRRVHRPAKKRR